MSGTPGDWSLGAAFGKGETGATGDVGNGIVNVLFTSTTDSSGLAGQSGGTDTYTITYTDSTTDTFVVYNGLDSDVQTVAGRVGNVVLTVSDITGLDKYTKVETDAKIIELAPSEIDDAQTNLTNTWSSSKIQLEVGAQVLAVQNEINTKAVAMAIALS